MRVLLGVFLPLAATSAVLVGYRSRPSPEPPESQQPPLRLSLVARIEGRCEEGVSATGQADLVMEEADQPRIQWICP